MHARRCRRAVLRIPEQEPGCRLALYLGAGQAALDRARLIKRRAARRLRRVLGDPGRPGGAGVGSS